MMYRENIGKDLIDRRIKYIGWKRICEKKG